MVRDGGKVMSEAEDERAEGKWIGGGTDTLCSVM